MARHEHGGTGAPALVTLDLWGVPARRVPAALLRMGTLRRPLRASRGVRFAKLLGTGHGRSFDVRDADLGHWGVLTVWDGVEDAERFAGGAVARSWARIAEEHLRVRMRPLTSTGRWSRREPFGRPQPARWDGPVAAITRARLAPGKALTFWRAVPPVARDLNRSPGLRLAIGIGEAPVGLQGTFSLWTSREALTAFVHAGAPHAEVVRRTHEVGWYAEELFARFAVLEVAGRFAGREP